MEKMVPLNASLSLSKVPLSLPLTAISTTTKNKQLIRQTRCFGLEGEGHSDMDVCKDNEPKEKHNDIWKLFTEAQQNILYLNKRRLMALEELDQLKREKISLLYRIEQLEAKRPLNTTKDLDKLCISSELLLRIDSMALTGMIGNREAFELRRIVMDSRISITDSFFEIMLKKDSELLVQLRNFSNKSKK